MQKVLNTLAVLVLLLNFIQGLGQSRIGVYNKDSLESNLDIGKWIEYEKGYFDKYLKQKLEKQMESYYVLVDTYQNVLHLSKDQLELIVDSIRKAETKVLAYQQELMDLKLKYDLGLERFLLAFLEESIEEIKSGHFDLVVEEEDLLFSDTKTTVPENITDKLTQHMNLHSDSYFFMMDWIIFKTSWRSGNYLSKDY